MGEQPAWQPQPDPRKPAGSPQYLTTDLATRPWAPPPPSRLHRYFVRGVLMAMFGLLALVLWSEHAQIRFPG